MIESGTELADANGGPTIADPAGIEDPEAIEESDIDMDDIIELGRAAETAEVALATRLDNAPRSVDMGWRVVEGASCLRCTGLAEELIAASTKSAIEESMMDGVR